MIDIFIAFCGLVILISCGGGIYLARKGKHKSTKVAINPITQEEESISVINEPQKVKGDKYGSWKS